METGRTSCRNPNAQNPPRRGGVRESFVARDGHVYCSIDFDTAELRSLAQVCLKMVGYSKLGDALNAGKDPHLMLAAQMLGIDYDSCVQRYKSNDKKVEDMRQFCKVGNFGFPGGLGARTFIEYAAGYGIKVSLKEANELRDAWFTTWAEMKTYFLKISAITSLEPPTLMQMSVVNGKPVSHRRRGNMFFPSAANSMFQGLTADGAKEALYQVTKACYEASPDDILYGVRPVMFLHDEIISEIPYLDPIKASNAAYKLAEIMRDAMASWVPDVKILCAPNMMRRWYKGAKAVNTVIDGQLILVPSKPVKQGENTMWVADV